MDEINHRFGRDSILIGMTPSQTRSSSSGSKIAFTRIPDVNEFFLEGCSSTRASHSLSRMTLQYRIRDIGLL